MALYQAYYDTAGSQRDEFVLVTVGVIATDSKWAKFEKRWRAVLARYEVSSFHMKDFAHFKCEFAAPAWQDAAYRSRFLAELCVELKRGINKAFISAVILADYRRYNTTHCVDETLGGAYSLAQAGCIANTVDWLGRKKRGDDKAIFFLEEGDSGQGAFLNFLKKDMGEALAVQVLPKSQPDGTQNYAFQAADLIAYEHRRMYERIAKTGRRQPEDAWRRSLAALRRLIPFEAGIYHTDSLQPLCTNGTIPSRS